MSKLVFIKPFFPSKVLYTNITVKSGLQIVFCFGIFIYCLCVFLVRVFFSSILVRIVLNVIHSLSSLSAPFTVHIAPHTHFSLFLSMSCCELLMLRVWGNKLYCKKIFHDDLLEINEKTSNILIIIIINNF